MAVKYLNVCDKLVEIGARHSYEVGDLVFWATASAAGEYTFIGYPKGDTTLWSESIRLSDSFYQALRDHLVPLLDAALRALSDDSVGLDLYIWLAYRLRSLDRGTPVSWSALHAQCGAGDKHVFQFKPRFIDALKRALAAYPEARVQIEADGLILRPSRAPIQERKMCFSRTR